MWASNVPLEPVLRLFQFLSKVVGLFASVPGTMLTYHIHCLINLFSQQLKVEGKYYYYHPHFIEPGSEV